MAQSSGATGGGMFSVREVEYLESLPAVERVRSGRIMYAEAFKQEAVRRYLDGESPAEIFRSAGLDSSLIGYKRIERSMARWRRTVQPASDKNRGGGAAALKSLRNSAGARRHPYARKPAANAPDAAITWTTATTRPSSPQHRFRQTRTSSRSSSHNRPGVSINWNRKSNSSVQFWRPVLPNQAVPVNPTVPTVLTSLSGAVYSTIPSDRTLPTSLPIQPFALED